MRKIDASEVRVRLDAVVAAMKEIGAWEVARPTDDQLVHMGAFGTNSMAFVQWLRWVLVPNVEELIASDGPWPPESGVAFQAQRENMWSPSPELETLIEPLRRFDRLFNAAEPPPWSPATAFDQSRAALAAGDHEGALAEIRELIARCPDHPNAHNFAGWLLMHATPPALDEAIAHFRAELERAPDEIAPFANLCDALVAAGRPDDALAEAERANTPAAHNWLGWRLIGNPATVAQAIEHFRSAIRLRPRWGRAHENLGRAFANADREDESFAAFDDALRCDDEFDRAYCHERMAAYLARRGWLRNALGHIRAALRDDAGSERRAGRVEMASWLEARLRAAGVEPPPPGEEDERRWQRACERELPPGLLDRNELGERLADDVIEVERLVRAERWDDVVRQLESLQRSDGNKLLDAAGYAERGAELARAAGHQREALAIMKLVVDAYRFWASGASSGAEGLGRTATADEKWAKLRRWMAENE